MNDALALAGRRIRSRAATTAGALALATVVAPAVPSIGPAAPAGSLFAQESFTIEQVLSAPMPGSLVAAPTGGTVAWVQNAEGVRNIWVASAPDYRARRVTDYAEDDGQEIGSLRFTRDGRSLFYTRGGSANPTSDPDGVDRVLWLLPLDGGEPRRMDIGSPTISPVDDVVAFTRGGGIWTLRLDDADAEPVQHATVRGGAGSLAWSPDGTRLAFASRRGDHGFVGVYDLEAGTLTWMEPSVDSDGSPAWSPDGRRLAFMRTPNHRGRIPFTPRREASVPWSIVVADARTGEARTVWTADVGPGSAFYGTDGPDLLWAAGDRLVFPWEKGGWLRLWSVPADNAGCATVAGARDPAAADPHCGATLLMPGEHEVQHVVISADARSVIYSSNRDDIDRKHLWRVPVDGSRSPELLTPGDGIEWSPTPTADGRAIAYLASDATTPAHARVLVDGDSRMLAPGTIPDDFPSDRLVTPEQVVFAAGDGMRIHGQLFLPPGLRAGERRPALLFFHGGSRRQMLLGFHPRGYYHNAYALNQYLASRGYIVLSVNYRSGIGYGLDFREAENYGASGASEYQDVIGAGLYLRNRPDVDPDRIGLWGGSYGGYLTAMGLARSSDLFAAGVDFHGVHDWNVVIQNFRSNYSPAEDPERTRIAYEASPIADIDSWRSPVLLIHADDDRNVPFSETVDLAEDLRRRGVDVETLIFPDDVHGFLLHRNWLAAYRATAEFFDRRLRETGAAAAN